jgi:starch synthase
MKILFAASEALPLAATGGLSDVACSLPLALGGLGAECRVVMPLYSDISENFKKKLKFKTHFTVSLSWRRQYCGVFEGNFNGVVYYLLDNEYYFKRRGLYGHFDDAERFAFFSKAVLEMLRYIDFKPDIIHSNDWHTALVPVYYRAFFNSEDGYRGIKTVFTIHNIQYQGKYGYELFNDVLGLPNSEMDVLKLDGCVNLVKGAFMSADAVTTVSPTYAEVLRDPFFSFGLDEIVKLNAYKFTGILNGIGTSNYNPETDDSIFQKYSAAAPEGKAANKSGLQKMLNLPQNDSALVVGIVGWLVGSKGTDLIEFVLKDMMTDHIQLVVLGKGDFLNELFFSEMQKRYPGKLAVRIGFLQDLARKIYAGSDVLLMPSQMEPCGLAQMIALRYGTIPVVRKTGGLNDSITDCGEPGGNGYTFQSFNAHDMLGALRRAEGAFVQKEYWKELITRAMNCDFSWDLSAGEYMSLYSGLMQKD